MTDLRNASKSLIKKTIEKRAAIRGLMDHPQYLQLPSGDRLNIVRKVQNGLPLSLMLVLLTAQHWVETGVIIERKRSEL